MNPKIISLSLPEYNIETQPDYESVGSKIDKALAENFEGKYLLRALSLTDHQQLSLDGFADIIVKTGTNKYDPSRKGIAHDEFEPYKPDIQAGEIEIKDGRVISEPFSADVKRFYENTLLDRGYSLRIDLIVLYDPEQMVFAEKVDHTKPNVAQHLEQYLWRFKNPENKPNAIKGMIKIS